MGFRKKNVEAPVQKPRPQELSRPLSERQVFFRDHINLDMDMREIRLLFAMAEEGQDIQSDLEELTKEIVIKLVKQFGEGTPELDKAKEYLLDRVLPASLEIDESNPALAKLQSSFLQSFLVSESVEKYFRDEVKEGKAELASVQEFFEKLPTFKKDLDQLAELISNAIEQNTVNEKNKMIESVLRGYLSEIKELGLEPELQSALFSHIANEVALAWGHNRLIVESMSEDYLLIKQLGYGANGEAYSALTAEGEQVAMKILTPRNPETNERLGQVEEDAARQFQRELYVLEEVEGEHLVDYKKGVMIPIEKTQEGEAEYTGWVAMEFIEGDNLKVESGRTEKYAIDDVVDLSLQAFLGIETLHSAGVIHRDIKPHNIMIDRSSGKPVVKLIDFGLALNLENPLEVDKNKESQGFSGTPLYMAPDALSRETLSDKVDVFSMGVIMYELLTKQHPFVDWLSDQKVTKDSIWIDMGVKPEKEGEKLKKAIPPKTIRSGIPTELNDFVIRALDREDPTKRPSAHEAVSILRSMLQQAEGESEGNPDLAQTTSIPGYRKSELVKTSQYEQTHTITETAEEKREKEIQTLQEIAVDLIDDYPYKSLTPLAFKLEMEKLLGALIPDEDIKEVLDYLKQQNKIRDNASSNEGYIVVRNLEQELKQQMERSKQSNPEPYDVDFDDFDNDIFGEQTRVLYEEQSVSLDLARQFLSANKRGDISQLQSDLSMTADATRQLLEKLDEEKFLSFDAETGKYVVGKKENPSFISRIKNFFQ